MAHALSPLDWYPWITRSRTGLISGLALILIGLLALAAQFFKIDMIGTLLLSALGLVFLAWGLLSRSAGLLIPGGILSGLGLGVILVSGPFANAGDPALGGVFLASFALGWALITLLSALLPGQFMLWPLIPGGIMAVIGTALLAGEPGLQILALAGQGWPLILIAIGLYMLLWRKGLQQ